MNYGPRSGVGVEQDTLNPPATPAFAKADDLRAVRICISSLMSRRMKEFQSRVEGLFTKVEEMSA